MKDVADDDDDNADDDDDDSDANVRSSNGTKGVAHKASFLTNKIFIWHRNNFMTINYI